MLSTSTALSTTKRYLVAAGAVGLSSAVGAALFPKLSLEAPFVFFLPAILVALWFGGFGASFFAILLSGLVIDFCILPPSRGFHITPTSTVTEVLFLLALALTAWTFERRYARTQRMLRLQYKMLETAEPVMMLDTKFQIAFWNKGAEQLYGWTRQEAFGRIAGDLLKTVYPESCETIMQQVRQSGSWHGRLTRTNRVEQTVVTETTLALDYESGYMLETGVDVTQRSRMEAELRRAHRALAALSRVNQLLTRSQNSSLLFYEAVHIIAEEGDYPLVWIAIPEHDAQHSVSVGASAGRAADYVTGIKVTWNDLPTGRGPIGRCLCTGNIATTPDLETDPGGATWSERAHAFGLRSSICLPIIVQGEIIAGLTIYAKEPHAFQGAELSLVSELAGDLSFGLNSLRLRERAEQDRQSRQLLEEQLRQAQKMEAIGRLAGGIAHDFNNLLMVILAQAELLSLQLNGPALTRIDQVVKSAQRAAALTHQLLAFSRKQIVQPSVLTLDSIIQETAKMAASLLGEDIDLAVSLKNDLWPVRVDRSQFEQVLMNLLVNARDAMPNGGQLTIETSNVTLTTEYSQTHPLMPAGPYVLTAVTDTGAGMSPETQARLFEPFFTTKPPGKGTGLGLSMVYGIVKQSGGFIWYYSELDKGTTFKIYLPAAISADIADNTTVSAHPRAVPKAATILVIEDEPALRNVVTEFLRSDGHRVLGAGNGEEALQLAAAHDNRIDLLLTDVVLKGPNGKQMAGKLHQQGCRCQVIFMSGYTPDAILHHGVLGEDTLFLQKPFTRAALLAKVAEALTD